MPIFVGTSDTILRVIVRSTSHIIQSLGLRWLMFDILVWLVGIGQMMRRGKFRIDLAFSPLCICPLQHITAHVAASSQTVSTSEDTNRGSTVDARLFRVAKIRVEYVTPRILSIVPATSRCIFPFGIFREANGHT